MTKFSERSSKLTSSPLYVFFRQVKAAEAAGRSVISLGVGEPYQDTPESIKRAGIAAIEANQTRYNPAAGSLKLRQRLAARYGVAVERVVTSNGAKPFLGSIFWSLVDPGDLVYLVGPVYPPFLQIVESCGGQAVLIDTKPDGFQLKLEALAAALKPAGGQAAYLLVNSPNNPSGAAYDPAELERVAAYCREQGITVISDECYSQFSPDPSFTFLKLDDQAIVINSFSKAYAMTGWRLGYAICPPELATVVGRYLDNYVGCASTISDAAALVALETEPLPDFVEQRQIMHAWLERNQVDFVRSTGGIFVFPDFSRLIERLGLADGYALAEWLLERAGVAATPGVAFGEAYQNHLRLCYSIDPAVLKAGLAQIDQAVMAAG